MAGTQDLCEKTVITAPCKREHIIGNAEILEQLLSEFCSLPNTFNVLNSDISDNGDGTFAIPDIENPAIGSMAITETLKVYEFDGTNWVLKVANVILSATGTSGVEVDNSDPNNLVIKLDAATIASLGKADSAVQPGDNVSELNNDADYSTNADVVHKTGNEVISGVKTFNTPPKSILDAGSPEELVRLSQMQAATTLNYMGVIWTADTPTQPGFYLAAESGTYTNAGGIAVDLNNGITYLSYDGVSWSDVVIPVDISSKADHGYILPETPKTLKEVDDAATKVADEMSEIIEFHSSSNLIDKTKVVLDSVFNNLDGVVVTLAGRGRTDKISIQENTTYTLKGARPTYSFGVYWDVNGDYLTYEDLGSVPRKVFTTPPGAATIGINFANSNASSYVDTLQLNLGDVDIAYEEFYENRILIKEAVLPPNSGGTAYDQSLNTTDSVEFASLRVGGILLDLPTSSSGLSVGQAWVDIVNGNVIKVV